MAMSPSSLKPIDSMSGSISYQETLDYIFEKLPMFSRLGKAALKPNLDNITAFCTLLGNPQLEFQTIHIAGTNGKGSVSHALAAILTDAGYKTGLSTSPHLVDFRERIRINGEAVERGFVIDFVDRYRQAIEDIQPSFFEITVAMAFEYFARQQVDVAVIEVGLGGRLDSTNLITPELSIITNISYDHKDLLGNTLAEIAGEKAGIIKHGVPVVVGEQHPETERVFFEHSIKRQSELYYADSFWTLVKVGGDIRHQHYKAVNKANLQVYEVKTDLTGGYQRHNIKTVLTAVELLAASGFRVNIDGAVASLAHVKTATGLMGRWQVLQDAPPIVCDVAHNPAGLREVFDQWKDVPAETKHIVVGFVKDKDVAEALALFPKDAQYYFCNAKIPRALPADELQCAASAAGLFGGIYPGAEAAFAAARTNMRANDALLVTGSFFIVGEVLECFENRI